MQGVQFVIVKSITTSLVLLHPTKARVLCVKHPSLERWMFPGGHVEPGEAPHVAALRELEEEVGITGTIVDLTGLPWWQSEGNCRLPNPLAMIKEACPDSAGQSYVDVVYAGVAQGDDLALRREILEAGWFDHPDVAHLFTTFPIRELAEELFRRADEIRAAARDVVGLSHVPKPL